MKIRCKTLLACLLAGSSLLLVGCGSDGGSSGPANATITDANKVDLAVTGTEAAKQAANGDKVPTNFKATRSRAELLDLSASIAAKLSAKTQDVAIPQPCSGGGTVDFVFTTSTSSINYANCNEGGVIFNGSAVITSTTAGDTTTVSIDYNNFTVNFNGEIESVDLSISCTTITGTPETNCTYNSTALGIDGRSYSVSNISVTGDEFSGYNISATATDPDHGNITIDASLVTFNCPDGSPDSGSIVITAGSATATVTFINCDEFSILFEGAAETFMWADIIN